MEKDKLKSAEKKISREKYEVLFAKNFGKGVKQPGEIVDLHPKAGEFYADRKFVKPVKK